MKKKKSQYAPHDSLQCEMWMAVSEQGQITPAHHPSWAQFRCSYPHRLGAWWFSRAGQDEFEQMALLEWGRDDKAENFSKSVIRHNEHNLSASASHRSNSPPAAEMPLNCSC